MLIFDILFFDQVNRLISTGKSIFIKAPQRIEKFEELVLGVPLPPSPVVTRRGTWIETVQYYSDNLSSLNKVIETLEETQAQSICECKELLQNVDLAYAVSFIA